jgi:hypothetical protein
MRPAVVLTVVLFATAVRAHSVSNELIVSSAQSTETAPRPALFTDSLNGAFDLSDDWTLNGGVSLTVQGNTTAASAAGFDQSSTPSMLFTGGLDWWADEHWLLGLTVDLSPKSTQYAVAAIPATTSTPAVDAQVRSESSQLGAALDVSWYSSGRSELEWSLSGGFGFSHSSVGQSIPQVASGGQTLTPEEFGARYCAAHPRIRNCTQNVVDAFNGTQRSLDFERLTGGITATFFLATDISLYGDYYIYNQDPALLDYRVAALAFGAGMPVAPLQFLVRPELQHRFGELTVRLWAETGDYAAGTGQSTSGIGGRIQYRFSRAFRAWVTAAGHKDVDDRGTSSGWATLSGGVGYRW